MRIKFFYLTAIVAAIMLASCKAIDTQVASKSPKPGIVRPGSYSGLAAHSFGRDLEPLKRAAAR